MPDEHHPTTGMQRLAVYRIRVRGQLDVCWSDWFGGMAITTTENGETLITGQVADQAELHGLLRQVRDLGLKLLAVNQCDPAAGSPQLPSPRSATEQ